MRVNRSYTIWTSAYTIQPQNYIKHKHTACPLFYIFSGRPSPICVRLCSCLILSTSACIRASLRQWFVDKILHRVPSRIQLFSSYRVVNTQSDLACDFLYKLKRKKSPQKFLWNRSYTDCSSTVVLYQYEIKTANTIKNTKESNESKAKTKYVLFEPPLQSTSSSYFFSLYIVSVREPNRTQATHTQNRRKKGTHKKRQWKIPMIKVHDFTTTKLFESWARKIYQKPNYNLVSCR